LRRPLFVWTSALAAVGFSALSAPAQQPRAATNPPSAASSLNVDPATDPSMAARPARYLLRNGQDYLSYREYDRALNFFRSVENRQDELSTAERQTLRQGIARAQQGKREAINGPHVVAHPQGRPTNPPGSFALARPASTSTARPSVAMATPTAPVNRRPTAPEPVELTGGTMAAAEPALQSSAPAPSPAGVIPSEPAPLDLPASVAVAPVPIGDGMELPTLPAAPPEPLPDLASPRPDSAPLPVAPEPAPATEPEPPLELPTLNSGAPTPVAANAGQDPTPTPADPTLGTELPSLPPESPPAPESAPAADPEPSRLPVQDPATVPAQGQPDPVTAPVEPPPAAEATSLPASASPAVPVGVDLNRPITGQLRSLPTSETFLSPANQAEIARLAQRSSDSPAGDRASAANPTNDPNFSTAPTQGSTRLELQRAPSPTEARPIRRIPVPEEFVPLGRRDWNPNRKYWAAAGTCHMTLYFQDPVLERYGQGVEQALGTRGRYFSYPLDDPKQSNQRNQILQPFYSIGKFCFQVGTLPYKLVVDPPWEAEYDLGYYRPGDRIPRDTIMMTPTGVGPPVKGRNY